MKFLTLYCQQRKSRFYLQGMKLQSQIDESIRIWRDTAGSSRKATILDVAQLAGVSKKTVSRVINKSNLVRPETRLTVEKVMHALDYKPDPQARGLAFRRSFLVGMIYDNPNPQYVVNLQEGILEGLKDTDYQLAIHRCDRTEPDFVNEAVKFCETQRLYGTILSPSASEDEQLASAILKTGCKIVRIASVKLDTTERMLISNDRIGGRIAAEYLITCGHRKIAHIEGKRGFISARERRAGFEEKLLEMGVTLPEQYCLQGSYTFESGVHAGQQLLSLKDRPTAVFAANDQMAAGMLHAMRRHNLRAPEDLSIMGYDDFEIAVTCHPRLTTIHSPTLELGKIAAQKLTQSRGDQSTESQSYPWLVVRESVANVHN